MPDATGPIDLHAALAVFAFMFLGGIVKGTLGFGLPLVTVPLIATLVSVPEAIALMSASIVVSNVYQVTQGAPVWPVLKRFWPLFLAIAAGCLVGAQFVTSVDPGPLNVVLGVVVILVALSYLVRIDWRVPPRHERPAGIVMGSAAGLLGGVSSFIGPPLIIYLVAINLSKDVFITTVAVGFVAGMIPLQGTLIATGFLAGPGALVSVLGILPVIGGMRVGKIARDRIPQAMFRNAILVMLLLIGANLVRRGLGL